MCYQDERRKQSMVYDVREVDSKEYNTRLAMEMQEMAAAEAEIQ